MSGKPAARLGDMTQKGGSIVQGSAGVLIGAPTGVACSVCPGGRTSGNPVNPLLGAKVLPGETDIALPGPLPFMLTRSYSSWQTPTPAPVGCFGPGWKSPADIRLQLRDDALIINDDGSPTTRPARRTCPRCRWRATRTRRAANWRRCMTAAAPRCATSRMTTAVRGG